MLDVKKELYDRFECDDVDAIITSTPEKMIKFIQEMIWKSKKTPST